MQRTKQSVTEKQKGFNLTVATYYCMCIQFIIFQIFPSNYRDTAMEAYPHPCLGFFFFFWSVCVAGSHVIEANLKLVI